MGNLEAKRDFTYVSDTVDGFLCGAQTTGIEGKTINLGVGSEIRIIELVNEIISILGKPIEIEVELERLRPAKSEVTRLLSDNRLAKELLGWSPHVSFREGLTKTIEWISEHRQYYHSLQYQI